MEGRVLCCVRNVHVSTAVNQEARDGVVSILPGQLPQDGVYGSTPCHVFQVRVHACTEALPHILIIARRGGGRVSGSE